MKLLKCPHCEETPRFTHHDGGYMENGEWEPRGWEWIHLCVGWCATGHGRTLHEAQTNWQMRIRGEYGRRRT